MATPEKLAEQSAQQVNDNLGGALFTLSGVKSDLAKATTAKQVNTLLGKMLTVIDEHEQQLPHLPDKETLATILTPEQAEKLPENPNEQLASSFASLKKHTAALGGKVVSPERFSDYKEAATSFLQSLSHASEAMQNFANFIASPGERSRGDMPIDQPLKESMQATKSGIESGKSMPSAKAVKVLGIGAEEAPTPPAGWKQVLNKVFGAYTEEMAQYNADLQQYKELRHSAEKPQTPPSPGKPIAAEIDGKLAMEAKAILKGIDSPQPMAKGSAIESPSPTPPVGNGQSSSIAR